MTAITTLSTMQKSLNSRSAIARQDAEQQKAQLELTTGLKSDVFSAHAYSAAQSLDLRNRMDRMDTFTTQNNLLASKLTVTSTAVENIRNEAQDFLTTFMSLGTNSQSDFVIGGTALASISRIASYLNTSYGGEYLFSGVSSGQQSFTMPDAGLSIARLPHGATLAQTQDELARIDEYFGFTAPTTTAPTFLDEAYRGSASQQTAQIEEYTSLSFGLTTGDESIRLIMKGLTMLSNTEMGNIGNADARTLWSDTARAAIVQGISKLQADEAQLGNVQSMVETAAEHQNRLKAIYNNSIVDLEGADSFEAATRFEAISSQLEASYAVTARINKLSLLDFI